MKTKGIAAAAVIVLAVLAFFFYRSAQSPPATMAETGEQIARQYSGTVIKSDEQNGLFTYTIEVPAQGAYELSVNPETGEVVDMNRSLEEEAESAAEEEASAGEELELSKEHSFSREEAKQLTPEEAGQIALAKVPGVIDDIELGDEEETGFYIVDIDAENGEEATVQVNTVSGEIASISWDD